MNYEALSKSELIEYIQVLEKKTLQAQWETFRIEAVLLGEDVVKLVKQVYELGVKTGKTVYSFVEQHKAPPVQVQRPVLAITPAEVVGIEETFDY